MGLREEAIAAAEAARDQRVASARAVLAGTLAPADVAGLNVVDETPDMVVFTDGANLCIAVRDRVSPPRVSLTASSQQGGWTGRGDVDSLKTLGRLLAAAEESA